MFGFLTARVDLLDEEQLKRYRSCYCGLCRSLRQRYGEAAGMLLTYDMTFLILLLSSLYEPEETSGDRACSLHRKDPRPWQHSEITDYAADMTVALSYFKSLDSWQDDSNPAGIIANKALKKAFRQVCAKYPRQCTAIENAIKRLQLLEESGVESADEAAACSGAMLRELFVLQEDRWSPHLRALGDGLGRVIYLMDAAVDLDKDTFWDSYNPFRAYRAEECTPEHFETIIKIFLGDCVREFDILPLVSDTQLMKNILCVGLWQEFYKKFGDRSDPSNGNVSGSV